MTNSPKDLKYIYILILTVFQQVFAQEVPEISGTVQTPLKEIIEYASVAILHPKDSTMINFTTTDEKGEFSILETSRDTLLLQIHYVGFHSYFQDIIIGKKAINLDTIILKEDVGELDEVVISAVVPIQIKKDTVAYNTNAFKINNDDNIEDMLGKLPGMEIDADGKVIAGGNEVTKIYVDGKEFFGGDPSVVLKNLPADVIAKIEVIDKKSDESELTGISDGEKKVILNFTLKKNRKNKGFGKASAGIGLDKRYFVNANYNRFTSKTQVSAIGRSNNINVTGNNVKEFLQNANGLGDEGEGEESYSPKRRLNGFLDTQMAALHYGHEFKKKESLNTDYTYNRSRNDGITYTRRITERENNNGIDSKFNSDNSNYFDNTNNSHKVNFNYKNQSHKSHSFFAKGYLNSGETDATSNRVTNIYNEENELRNINQNTSVNNLKRDKANITLNYYKKLDTLGKNIATAFSVFTDNLERYNTTKTIVDRNLNTENPSQVINDIYRDEKFDVNTYNFSIKYTQPLGGFHFIKLEGYNNIKNNNQDVTQLRTIITDNNREELLAFLYKHTEYNYFSRLGYSYNTRKLNAYAGIEYQDYTRNFGQTHEPTINRNSNFLNPKIVVQYVPKSGYKYRAHYKKYVRAPSSVQSSTVINDLNPYFIRMGNPSLVEEIKDEYFTKVNIHDYQSKATFYGSLKYTQTQNAIIATLDIDDEYVRTRSFENSGNRVDFTTLLSFSKKIKGANVRYTLKNKNTFGKSNILINFDINQLNTERSISSIKLENYNKKIYDLKVGAEYSYTRMIYSIKRDLNRLFTTQKYYSSIDYDITDKLTVNTQFDYYIYTDNKFKPDTFLPLWNGAVSYSLSKRKKHVFKLLLIDILNKNINIDRRNVINFSEETIAESLGRYVVLSYTYKLNGNKRPKKKKK